MKNANLLEESKTFYYVICIQIRFTAKKLILGSVSMHLKLTRSIDLFVLQSSEDNATYCNKITKAI